MKQINNDIKHIWSVLCEYSTLDSETNNLSLFNLTEKLVVNISKEQEKNRIESKARGFLVLVKLELINKFRRKMNKNDINFDVEFNWVNPKGEKIMTKTNKLSFKDKIRNIRLRSKIDKINVDETGEYLFTIGIKRTSETKFKKMAEVPLDIEINIQ